MSVPAADNLGKHAKGWRSTSDETWDHNPICLHCRMDWPCPPSAAADLLEAIDDLLLPGGDSDEPQPRENATELLKAIYDLLHPNPQRNREPEHIPYGGTPYLETSGKLLRSGPSKHQLPKMANENER